MTRTTSSWWERARVRRLHGAVWTALTGTVVALGGLTLAHTLGWVVTVLVLLFGTVVAGSCVVIVTGEGRESYLLALRVGVLTASVTVGTSGLVHLVGPVGFLAAALVALTWPGLPDRVLRLTRWVRRTAPSSPLADEPPAAPARPRPRTRHVDMSEFEAALLDVDQHPPTAPTALPDGSTTPMHEMTTDEVCRLWRRTFVLLAQDITPQTTLELLAVRDQCLQELMVRAPSAYQQLLASGETPANDLSAFFRDGGGTRA